MSGALRLSKDIDASEREERVDELLNDLGLSAVADCLVRILPFVYISLLYLPAKHINHCPFYHKGMILFPVNMLYKRNHGLASSDYFHAHTHTHTCACTHT